MTTLPSTPLEAQRQVRGKRLFDASLSGLLLIILSPVLTAIAFAIRLTMGKPILYRQMRTGLRGMPFVLCKFRTMRPLKSGEVLFASDPARITTLGAFLRATSLDELPSLVNVFVGQMSLVGPRPLPVLYDDRYTARERTRHNVKPGITGLAQISGRNDLSWDRKFDLDLQYVANVSWRLDAYILLATLLQILSPRAIAANMRSAVTELHLQQDVDEEHHEVRGGL